MAGPYPCCLFCDHCRAKNKGVTPLLLATSRCNHEAVRLLLESKARPDLAVVALPDNGEDPSQPPDQKSEPDGDGAGDVEANSANAASAVMDGCEKGDSELCCAVRLADFELCQLLVRAKAAPGTHRPTSKRSIKQLGRWLRRQKNIGT